ncbi:MAG: hypothetical protein MI867_29825 [Pseudomonadales bacterium]|nr:hypothetical protein [Pseudomonadales bacterium]
MKIFDRLMEGTKVIAVIALLPVTLTLQGCLIPTGKPDGEYSVGTMSYGLEDPTRLEVMTDDPDDIRRIKLQFWYPTNTHRHLRLGHYLELVPKLVNSLIDAPILDTTEKFPLVIMSHGLGGNGNHSEFISESLASHGYLVAGLDHTYYGGPISFPNGDQLSSIINMLRFTGPQVTDELLADYFDVWVEDCHFLLEEINRINDDPESPWYQRIDTQEIAMVSHSFGGSMGMQCATEDSSIVATINMDGDLRGTVKDTGTTTPFMMIWPGDSENNVDHRFVDGAFSLSPNYYWASIINSQHGDFADHNRLLNPGGEPNIKRKHKIILDLIHAFLDEHLMGNENQLLRGEGLEDYPEMLLGKTPQ